MSTRYPMGGKKKILDPTGVFVFQFISLPICTNRWDKGEGGQLDM